MQMRHLATPSKILEIASQNAHLFNAIRKGNLSAVKTLLEQGADPHQLDENKQTPLSLAISIANTNEQHLIVAELLKKPLTVNIGAALLVTISQKQIKETRVLLEKAGKDLAIKVLNHFHDQHGKTPFKIALEDNDPAIVSILKNYTLESAQTNNYPASFISDEELFILYKQVKTSLINRGECIQSLEALSERAIQVINQLNSKDVYLIYALIFKSGLENEEFLNPLLLALHIPIQNQWNQFNIDRKKITYLGRSYAFRPGNIQRKNAFINHVITSPNDFNLEEAKQLGAVDLFNPANYFERSQECEQYATEFLRGFWGNTDYFNATIAVHHTKYQNKSIGIAEALAPSCISFVAVTRGEKKLCLVHISSETKISSDIQEKLKTYIADYNKNQAVVFSFTRERNIYAFNQTIKCLTRDPGAMKNCAEKFYFKELIELLLTEGDQLHITGAVNCHFYPYQQSKKYGMDDTSIDRYVLPKLNVYGSKQVEISDHLLVNFIPCCSQCRDNKPVMLAMLMAARREGIKLSTGFSLLPQQSLLAQKEQRTGKQEQDKSLSSPTFLKTSYRN